MTTIRFTLNGESRQLSNTVVEARLAGVDPESITKHAVQVGGVWFPVQQAFEVAVGEPRASFISHTARRHLAALGFPVRGDVASREGAVVVQPARRPAASSGSEWHTEANVQAAVVTALVAQGCRILSVANTATKERGVDIVASSAGATMGVEVKGFPSKDYADPARAAERKPTSPSTQAGHWYAAAVLAAMRLRGREPGWRSIVAFPDFGRYRDLYGETHASLAAAEIHVWWVSADGTVDFSPDQAEPPDIDQVDDECASSSIDAGG